MTAAAPIYVQHAGQTIGCVMICLMLGARAYALGWRLRDQQERRATGRQAAPAADPQTGEGHCADAP